MQLGCFIGYYCLLSYILLHWQAIGRQNVRGKWLCNFNDEKVKAFCIWGSTAQVPKMVKCLTKLQKAWFLDINQNLHSHFPQIFFPKNCYFCNCLSVYYVSNWVAAVWGDQYFNPAPYDKLGFSSMGYLLTVVYIRQIEIIGQKSITNSKFTR